MQYTLYPQSAVQSVMLASRALLTNCAISAPQRRLVTVLCNILQKVEGVQSNCLPVQLKLKLAAKTETGPAAAQYSTVTDMISRVTHVRARAFRCIITT